VLTVAGVRAIPSMQGMGCKVLTTVSTCFYYFDITTHRSLNVCECLQLSGHDNKRHCFSPFDARQQKMPVLTTNGQQSYAKIWHVATNKETKNIVNLLDYK
jgi:hypothetical protein